VEVGVRKRRKRSEREWINIDLHDGKVDTTIFGHHSTNKALGYFLTGLLVLLSVLIFLAALTIFAIVINVALFATPLIILLLYVFLTLVVIAMSVTAAALFLGIPLHFILRKLGREGFLTVGENSFDYNISAQGFRKRVG